VPPGCTESTASFDSIDTPLPITDLQTTTSTIAVSGLGGYLHDVDVSTSIAHTWNAQLEIVLTSPSGTAVTLTTLNGGSNDHVFDGTSWDDDAGVANPPGPVTDAVYVNNVTETPLVPEEAFSHLRGEDPNGDWVLTIFDDSAFFEGELATWTLTLATLDAPPNEVTGGFVSVDTPLPINNLQTTTSTIAVAGLDGYVCDVDVSTSITHTWNADLEIVLTSPSGTPVTLSTANGGMNDDVFDGTLWTDDAGVANPPGPVTDAVYVNQVTETPLCPEEAFGALIGEDPNGDWVLGITDTGIVDQGILGAWGLQITTCGCAGADLEIFKTAILPLAGVPLAWAVTVTNNGPDDATGVVVTDPLDPCTTYIRDTCGGSDVPPWTWNVGSLPALATVGCSIEVDFSGCTGLVSNIATVAGNVSDPMPGNNQSTIVIGVPEPPPGGPPAIPTLGGAGLAVLLLVIALAALAILRRQTRGTRMPPACSSPGRWRPSA
jgi:uncharacterized repeat protein (TIGR01451 family)